MNKWFVRSFTSIILTLASIPQIGLCDVSLPKLVSDGAILQRESKNLLWGWAKNGEEVTVNLNGKTIGKTTTSSGKWAVELKEQIAGGPHTIDIIGKNTLTIKDVYFGDVWIASGQSNMQTSMERIKDKFPLEVATANYPQIRMFIVPGKYDFNTPAEDVAGGNWMSASPQTIEQFTGVAYFFAKNLYLDNQVPIGIINSSYGGSPAEAWMSAEALKQFPHYLEDIRLFRNSEYLSKVIERDKIISDQWYLNISDSDLGMKKDKEWFRTNYDASSWKTMEIPGFWEDNGVPTQNGVVWFKKDFTLPSSADKKTAHLMLGRIVNADTAYINGVKVGGITYEYPPRRYQVPENILKTGKNTITVRVLSYTGKGGFIKDKPYYLEVNENKIDLNGPWLYKVGTTSPPIDEAKFNQFKQPLGRFNAMLSPLLKTSIKGVIWYQGESNTDRPQEYAKLFPALIQDWRKQFNQGNFPFLFVQLANFMEAKKQPSESAWAETREAQLKALSEPNTAMAVTIDVGEWNDIHPLDKKTVGDRLALAAKKLAYGITRDIHSGPLFDSLTVNGKKVTLHFKHTGQGLTYRGKKLEGFAIKESKSRYVWANAEIEGDKVIVWSDQVEDPSSIRYAWADNPDTANLYNKDGLPASPFQAEIKK